LPRQGINAELLGRLLDEHADALVLYARQWCDSPEDVVQEALIRLARQRAVPAHVVPWLYRVVRNQARSTARSARRRQRREAAVASREAWFSLTDDRLDGEAARAALTQLPQLEREVIVARLWGGLTFEEIGGVCEISTSTAHRRYAAGLRALRARLEAKTNPTSRDPSR
jgi:RNA polymerase sigma factor (sigma-70 family)